MTADGSTLSIASDDPIGETARKLIHELCEELSGRYGAPPSPFSPSEAARKRTIFLVARLGGEPVGCAALRRIDDLTAEVKRMYVAPSGRRKGIARRLMAALEDHAAKFNYRAIRLETGILQPEAQRLYESCGFKHIPAFGAYVHDPRCVCYEKILDGKPLLCLVESCGYFLHRLENEAMLVSNPLIVDLDMIRRALAEDVGTGDVTTLATVPPDATASAAMVAREPLVVCGLSVAEAVFKEVSAKIEIERLAEDGLHAHRGQALLRLRGPAGAMLTAERVALNFVQRLSGVASLTARFVEAVAGTRARILDTRKTTPGWRALEKYAVIRGGGMNHRAGLYDRILIKDNHLAALRLEPPNAIEAAVRRAREKYPKLEVEVEADTLEQVEQALLAKADVILLDNMSNEDLRAAVWLVNGRAKTEASGGVSLAAVRAIAETGVDFISVGALTHSARAVDVALDFKN